MDGIVKEEMLHNAFPYLHNITLAGQTERCINKFLKVISERDLTTKKKTNKMNWLMYLYTLRRMTLLSHILNKR